LFYSVSEEPRREPGVKPAKKRAGLFLNLFLCTLKEPKRAPWRFLLNFKYNILLGDYYILLFKSPKVSEVGFAAGTELIISSKKGAQWRSSVFFFLPLISEFNK
jgi:hypothetical protein